MGNVNGPSETIIEKGVDVNSKMTDGIAAAIAAAKSADVVVLALGNDRSQEHEGIDRPDTALPGLQESFALQVLEAIGAKPSILVLVNGGALAIDKLVAPVDAIVEAFSPSQFTPELAALLFGDENRWGKLPYTIYPHAYAAAQPMVNYDMSKAPGRTYKYFKDDAIGPALFSFGDGLSYTSFKIECNTTMVAADSGVDAATTLGCTVANVGGRAGDEVLQVYHQAGAAIRAAAAAASPPHPVPIKALIAFERVSLNKGESTHINWALSDEAFMLIDGNGDRKLYKGERTLVVSNGAGQSSSITITL